jgi:hypothetical protein
MKIQIEIPEWVEKKRVCVFLGMDHYIAYDPINDQWWRKVERCSLCGKCCIGQTYFGQQEIGGNKYCGALIQQQVPDPRIPPGQKSYLCGALGRMPWLCHEEDPTVPLHPDCTIRWEKFDPRVG